MWSGKLSNFVPFRNFANPYFTFVTLQIHNSMWLKELLCGVAALQSCGEETTACGPSRLLWTSTPAQTARSTCSSGEPTICLRLQTTRSSASWRWRRGSSRSRSRTGWGAPTCWSGTRTGSGAPTCWSGTWRMGTALTSWRCNTDARSESCRLLSGPWVLHMSWTPRLGLVQQVSDLKRVNNLMQEQDFFALKSIKIPVQKHSFLTETRADPRDQTSTSVTPPERARAHPLVREATDFLMEVDSDMEKLIHTTNDDVEECADHSEARRRLAGVQGSHGADWGIKWWNAVVAMILIGIILPLFYVIYYKLRKKE